MRDFHRAVQVDEIISFIAPRPGGVYLDATLGGCTVAAELLERSGPDGTLIGIDRDPDAVSYARERLKAYGDRALIVKGNFADLGAILHSLGIGEIDGSVHDLGVSAHQLEADRGFSLMRDEPLDMRMDRSEDIPTAEDIVNSYSESDLAEMVASLGEERYARRIARAIAKRRADRRISRTGELAEIITSAVPPEYRWRDIHPATKAFMSIRLAVNRELEAVEVGIPAAIDALRPGARACVVSFHSLEDRIVKTAFRRLSGRCQCPRRSPECVCGARRVVRVLTPRPVVPSAAEIEGNRRSRSAKLRCAEKLES